MTQLQKQRIVLIVLSIALVFTLAGFLCVNKSLAWFAANRRVEAEGLAVSAKVSPNLVIYKSADEIDDEDKAFQFSVDFEGTSRENMIAVTRDADATAGGAYALKYLANTHAVGHESGLPKKDAEGNAVALAFTPVPEDGKEAYFIDYTVYIASAGVALPAASLTATIVLPTPLDADHKYANAVSIDFYVGTADAAGYRGTASVKSAATPVELFPSGGTVPLCSEGSITVIMRCYFDGALTYTDEETGKERAYINSFAARTDGIAFGVDFVATDATAG